MTYRYTLKGDIAVPEPDLMRWARWIEDRRNARVDYTRIGSFFVSTVFLGLDHNYTGLGPPVFWETMVFWKRKAKNKKLALHQERCSGTKVAARAMHEQVCSHIRRGLIWWT